ncbi:histidine phosphatase family protein [Amphibiibacter pelophylacis]|uniref:Histidine phosphatase family protein n=1 Tax=Amphibiibacter pelophylacis TaxID=1799477 RepID=A0ACC6NY57_9BURK
MSSKEAGTNFLLVRHGETDWNVERRLQGHTDIALNARGLEQAAQTAQALRFENVQRVVSSDLQRARQTAQAVLDALTPASALPPLQLEISLRERHFGVLQGRSAHELQCSDEPLARIWHERQVDAVLTGGESLAVFHARVVEVLERLATQHAGETVVLVAHGGVLDSMYRHIRGLPLHTAREWLLPNAAIHRVSHHPQRGWQVLAWADERHLKAARDEVDAA